MRVVENFCLIGTVDFVSSLEFRLSSAIASGSVRRQRCCSRCPKPGCSCYFVRVQVCSHVRIMCMPCDRALCSLGKTVQSRSRPQRLTECSKSNYRFCTRGASASAARCTFRIGISWSKPGASKTAWSRAQVSVRLRVCQDGAPRPEGLQ